MPSFSRIADTAVGLPPVPYRENSPHRKMPAAAIAVPFQIPHAAVIPSRTPSPVPQAPHALGITPRTPSPVHRNMGIPVPVQVLTPTPARACMPPPLPQDRSLEVIVPVVGKQVDYWSGSFGCWMPATTTAADAERGFVELDVKPGVWMQARGCTLRPRSRPSQQQLERMRDILHEGHLQAEASRFFVRHAEFVDAIGEAVLMERMARVLGAEVDEMLGVMGSAIWLRKNICESPDRMLLLDPFMSLFCRKLWSVYTEYGQAANPGGAVPHRLGDPQDVYDFEKKLGVGTYGSVFLAREQGSHARRAVKMIKKQATSMANTELEHEIGHLCALDHPHIIKLYEYFETADCVYLVMDYCPGGDLQDMINKAKKNGRCLNEDFVFSVLQQILMGIAHVHARGIMHLDLKPGNVMLTPSRGTMPPAGQLRCPVSGHGVRPHAMIIDLGVARIFQAGSLGAPCGTPSTMAPEVWKGVLTPKADVYSLGVTFFEMLCNSLPFEDIPCVPEHALRYWGWTNEVPIPEAPWRKLAEAAHQARTLCQEMMTYIRRNRPTASECLASPFFSAHDVASGDRRSAQTACDPSAPSAQDHAVSQVIIDRLSKARLRTALQHSVSLSIARQWPANQWPSVKKAFEALDISGTGQLQKPTLIARLAEHGVACSLAREMVEAMDLDRDGIIDWTEFVSACIQLDDESLQDDLRKVFNIADQNGDGLLSAADIASLLASDHLCQGEAIGDAIDGMIDVRDVSARIGWKDFQAYFRTPGGRRSPPNGPFGVRCAVPKRPDASDSDTASFGHARSSASRFHARREPASSRAASSDLDSSAHPFGHLVGQIQQMTNVFWKRAWDTLQANIDSFACQRVSIAAPRQLRN